MTNQEWVTDILGVYPNVTTVDNTVTFGKEVEIGDTLKIEVMIEALYDELIKSYN